MLKHGAVRVWVGVGLLLAGMRSVQGQALPYPGPRTCATQSADNWQQQLLQRRLPGYRPAKLAATVPRLLRTTAVTYTLPVVVHIIHNGEAVGTGSNISQAQVQSQLDVLNEDYRNRNANGAQVPAPFQPLRADAQFQFVPAQRDPSGHVLPEPGIDRVDRTARGFAAPPYVESYIDATIKPATDWNPDQYVNIWVMQLGGNLLGYAQYPDNTAGLAGLSPLGGDPATDGVVVLYSAFGRVGTLVARYNQGRTLTHELGHWLGLRHIWGDTTCGDDYCADTPTQESATIGCPAFPHLSVICPNGPSGDMFMNFLDYTDDACMQLFSLDQKSRMQAVMAAGTPRRASLLSSPALCNGTVVAATAGSSPACAGSPATLTATGPPGASYAWTGPNGFSSALQNPVLPAVTAAQAGTYTVQVSVTTGACPATASTTLVVNPAPAPPVPTASTLAFCPGAGASVALAVANPLAGALYTWTVVSGDGLPAVATTPAISVVPTQSSTYRVTVALPGSGCAASATLSIQVLTPIWSGAAGTGNWFDAANWTGCVPTRTTDALIPAGLSTPYPTISSGTAEVRTLTQQGPLTLTGGELAFYGDYTGTGPLTQTGGTVATRGTGAQNLRGLAYQTLVVGGTGSKAIGVATITQALQLRGGVLSTGSATLTLAPAATISETDDSYVLGQVQTTHLVGMAPDSFGGLGLGLTAAVAPGPTTVLRTTGPALGNGGAATIQRYYDLADSARRGLQGATLSLSYLPHELNGLPEAQLTLYRSADAGATWTAEGATQRDLAAHLVARSYVADPTGRWTLAGPAAPLAPAALTYAITAFPVPFSADGLAFQISTPTAGPLTVQLYDELGRAIYNHDVANVEIGTSIVSLPGSGALRPAKYLLVVRQGSQTAHLSVMRE